MKKIIDYTVVSAIDTGNLIDLVFEHIEEGWEPFGSVVLAYERNIHRKLGPHDVNLPNDFEHYAQALVRYESGEEVETSLGNKMLRLPAIMKRTGFSRSAIYKKIADGEFPKPIHLGRRSVRWLGEDIEQWIQECIDGSRE